MRLSYIPPAAAPSSLDVEQPLPTTSPGGRLPLGAPVQTAPAPAAPAAAGPAARAGRFGTVYNHRPIDSPLPIRQYGAIAGGLRPPTPPP